MKALIPPNGMQRHFPEGPATQLSQEVSRVQKNVHEADQRHKGFKIEGARALEVVPQGVLESPRVFLRGDSQITLLLT